MLVVCRKLPESNSGTQLWSNRAHQKSATFAHILVTYLCGGGGLCAYHYLCNTFSSELCSKTHLQEKNFECWDSNLGLLVEKRERYPCAMPFPHPNSHKSPVCGEKRKRDRSSSWKSLPTQVASFHDKQLERDFDFEAWVGRRPDWVWHIQMKSCFASTRISRLSR